MKYLRRKLLKLESCLLDNLFFLFLNYTFRFFVVQIFLLTKWTHTAQASRLFKLFFALMFLLFFVTLFETKKQCFSFALFLRVGY